MNKNLVILGIAVLLICVGLSGCLNTDAETVLVNGGEWTSLHTNSLGYDELESYVFFEDGDYRFEQSWDKGDSDYTWWRSSGTFHIADDRIYFEEEKSEISINGYSWSDVDLDYQDWSLTIIDSNTVEIGLYKFHN